MRAAKTRSAHCHASGRRSRASSGRAGRQSVRERLAPGAVRPAPASRPHRLADTSRSVPHRPAGSNRSTPRTYRCLWPLTMIYRVYEYLPPGQDVGYMSPSKICQPNFNRNHRRSDCRSWPDDGDGAVRGRGGPGHPGAADREHRAKSAFGRGAPWVARAGPEAHYRGRAQCRPSGRAERVPEWAQRPEVAVLPAVPASGAVRPEIRSFAGAGGGRVGRASVGWPVAWPGVGEPAVDSGDGVGRRHRARLRHLA